MGLKITIEANNKIVDFLDVSLDLQRNIYKPFLKPNNPLLYVHRDSNHPPSILKNIPESINRRLSELSKNEDVFNEAAPQYQNALKNSGYNFELKFNPPTQNSRRNKPRSRNIVWFNPPFSKNIATNIGQEFFKLLERCFPPDHILRPIINKNTVKLSYSCLPNMGDVMNSKNKSLIRIRN